MPRRAILQELELLSHAGRMRYMVEIGRRAASDRSITENLDQLSREGVYERALALQACYGSRDGERILRALEDSSRLMRGLAVKLVPEVCNDGQARRALASISSAHGRHALLRRLSKKRRLALVDEHLETMVSSGDARAGSLLSYGSAAFVERQLIRAVQQGLHETDWARLARYHPLVTANVLCRQAAAAIELDARLVACARAALFELADKVPASALELVRLLLRHVAPSELPLQRLVERLPAPMADLVLTQADPSRVKFARVAQRLDLNRLEALLARRPDVLPLDERWFRRLLLADRLALFRAFECGWRNSDGCLPHWLVARLPGEERMREARSHWHHAPLAARPAERLPYAAFLPWDEARGVLEPFIRNPNAELRAAASAALVGAVRFERGRAGELAHFLLDRKNEQDPVRCAFVSALARLPPKLWQARNLDALGQIIRQALDAADLSNATAAAAENLVVAVLPFHPDWSVAWLATLVKERGQLNLGELHDRLSDTDMARIAPALLPVLRSWDTRERQSELLGAAHSLGRRLRVFPQFATILEGLALNAHAWKAAQALWVIAAHCRDRFGPLVQRLLKSDPSWVTQIPVYNHLHHRRQDLLTPFLGRQPYRGKFSTGKTRFVLPIMGGFHKWTASQQATFAATLEEIARDSERDSPAKLTAIKQLASLPAVVPAELFNQADARNKSVVTRDAALRALGRLDGGDGVPFLLEAMQDDRGRSAIYALRRSLLEMPAPRALQLLCSIPLDKVTIAKEVARLLGELQSDEAYRELLSWDAGDLHRDVRIAVLRALWGHLERDASWPILVRAAASPDPAVATIVGRIPADRLSETSQRRLAQLVAMLLAHPEPKVRCDVLARCETLPLSDDERVMLSPLLAALKSDLPDEVEAAAAAVFATYVGRNAETLGGVIRELLPHRRSLDMVLSTLQSRLVLNRTHLRPVVEGVLSVIAVDPLAVTHRARLTAITLSGEPLAAALQQLAPELHAEALLAVVRLIAPEDGTAAPSEALMFDEFRPLPKTASPTEPGEWREVESSLASHSDERLRRIALAALVAQANSPAGWTDELRARLEVYQIDVSTLVASAAVFTFPPRQP